MDTNYRQFQVRADDDSGEIRGVLTTEQPVVMFDWQRGQYIPEVLLMSGMKARGRTVRLLDTHNTTSVRNVLGSYTEIKTHKAAGETEFDFVDGQLEFSSVETEIATKVREKHINEMSVGYEVDPSKTVYVPDGETLEHDGQKFTGPVNIRTQWKLNEASVVPIGADDQAKIHGFRSMQDALKQQGRTPGTPEPASADIRGDSDAGKPARSGDNARAGDEMTGQEKPIQNKTMDNEKTPEPLTDEARAQIVAEGANAERKRQNDLDKLEKFANAAGLGEDGAREFVAGYRSNGKSADEAHRALAELSQFNDAPSHTEPEAHAALGLNEKEKRSYSIVRAVSSMLNGGRLEGLEKEVSDAIATRTGRTPDGFFVAGARDLTAGTATDGAELVDTDLRSGDFIDVLRPNMLSRQLGIRVLSGLTGDVSIPRKTSASAASWVADESTTAHSESEPQFDAVSLTPNHLGCFTDVSKQLLHQGTPDAEALVRDDLNMAISVALDAAVFKGTGTAQPQGIIGATGVQTSTVAAAGSPTLAELVEFESDIDTGNALMGSLSWVTTPAVRGYLRQTLLTAAVSCYMWGDNEVLGYSAYSTSQLAANSIIFGNFNDYILGVFDGVDLVIDPYGDNAKKRLVTLTVNLMADGDVRHGASFCTNA